MIMWQEEHPAHKNLFCYATRFSSGIDVGDESQRSGLPVNSQLMTVVIVVFVVVCAVIVVYVITVAMFNEVTQQFTQE